MEEFQESAVAAMTVVNVLTRQGRIGHACWLPHAIADAFHSATRQDDDGDPPIAAGRASPA
jgi:hypothetical protein